MTTTEATRTDDSAQTEDLSRTNGTNRSFDSTSDELAAADAAPFGQRSVPDEHEYAVLLAAFDDDEAASDARECLTQVGSKGAAIRDVVTLRSDACGVVHIRRLPDNSTRKGLAAGVLGGLGVGLLLAPPLALSMVGLGLAGAAVGKLRHEYRKAGTGAALLGAIRPNTSALLAVVKAEDVTKAAAALPAHTTVRTTYVDQRAAAHLSLVARRIG